MDKRLSEKSKQLKSQTIRLPGEGYQPIDNGLDVNKLNPPNQDTSGRKPKNRGVVHGK